MSRERNHRLACERGDALIEGLFAFALVLLVVGAGGTGENLRASASEAGDEVTVSVEGEAPRLFSLPLLLPAVRASASLLLERYPTAEAAP